MFERGAGEDEGHDDERIKQTRRVAHAQTFVARERETLDPRWTTQKVFHLLNFVCAGVRAGVFPVRRSLDRLRPEVVSDVLLDVPGLLFFTTYALLVLFWAEIYHQARSLPTGGLRPAFVAVNAVVYVFQGALWAWAGVEARERRTLHKVSSLFLAVVCCFAVRREKKGGKKGGTCLFCFVLPCLVLCCLVLFFFFFFPCFIRSRPQLIRHWFARVPLPSPRAPLPDV